MDDDDDDDDEVDERTEGRVMRSQFSVAKVDDCVHAATLLVPRTEHRRMHRFVLPSHVHVGVAMHEYIARRLQRSRHLIVSSMYWQNCVCRGSVAALDTAMSSAGRDASQIVDVVAVDDGENRTWHFVTQPVKSDDSK